MEHTNPERKPLSELIKEAEANNQKIVLVIEPVTDGHHRIAAFISMEQFMVIRSSNLLEEDQKRVLEMHEQATPFTQPEPIPIVNIREIEPLPDNIVLREDDTLHHVKPTHLKMSDMNKRVLPNLFQMKKNMLRNHRRK